jgi:hypothetical protein
MPVAHPLESEHTMSVTLTDRDSGTIVITQASASADGISYSVAGGTMADYKLAYARHQNVGVSGKNSRHNFRIERRKVDTDNSVKTVTVDVTISVANSGLFTADDVDDLVTAAGSYFAAESDTGNFIIGVNR